MSVADLLLVRELKGKHTLRSHMCSLLGNQTNTQWIKSCHLAAFVCEIHISDVANNVFNF